MVENVLHPRCNLCKSSQTPGSACSSCKVTRYCNQEHQLSDWPAHKSVCSKIKRARAKLEREETKLRNDPGDGFFDPPNPFESSVGHFWGILSTRDYMRARINWVIEVLKIDSHDAVTTALDNLRDMLRLCRSDNLGVRDMIPDLYLRLHQDQKCYDFLKWYATEGQRMDYDWGNMSLPYLNLENEDVMEDVTLFCEGYSVVAHGLPVTLIKVRVLLDLRDLLASSALLEIPDKLSFDVVHHIQQTMDLRSSILSARPELFSLTGLEDRIQTLEKQTDALFAAMHKGNRRIWEAIVHPKMYAHQSPSSYSAGSVEETVILLLSNGKSWRETDGAVDWVKKQLASQ